MLALDIPVARPPRALPSDAEGGVLNLEDYSLEHARPVVVVPCYNEARRLQREGFLQFLRFRGVQLLFVDDGSTDDTHAVLQGLAAEMHGRAWVLALPQNAGKGEAVRRGLAAALAQGAEFVGYFDADLATPPEEMCRLFSILVRSQAQGAIAARVGLLGTRIDRKLTRHYLGRVFATAASLILQLPVYDTQCGAKAFRRSDALIAALSTPFSSRWAFDVELIGRLVDGAPPAGEDEPVLVEMPLKAWADVDGSKLSLADWPRMGIDLARVGLSLARWRRSSET